MTTPCRTINANAIAAPSPSGLIFNGFRDFVPIEKRLVISSFRGLKLPSRTTKTITSSDWSWSYRSPGRLASASTSTSAAVTSNSTNRFEALEEGIEKVNGLIADLRNLGKAEFYRDLNGSVSLYKAEIFKG